MHRYVYCVCIFKLQLTAKKCARGTRRCWHHLYLTRMNVNHISASYISVCYPYCQVMASSIGFTDYLYYVTCCINLIIIIIWIRKNNASVHFATSTYLHIIYFMHRYLIFSDLFMYLNAYLRFTYTILLARVAIFFLMGWII